MQQFLSPSTGKRGTAQRLSGILPERKRNSHGNRLLRKGRRAELSVTITGVMLEPQES